MGVYHFTLHAYRSWRPDHPRGFTVRGEGYQPPDSDLAEEYDDRAAHPPVRFTPDLQLVLVLGCISFCRRRRWRLHAVGTDPTHVHFVVSWFGHMDWSVAMQRVKNVLSYLLGKVTGQAGRRWFVRNGSRKRVLDRAHLEYLVGTYLPDHRGLCWSEGQRVPEDPYGIL